MIDPSQLPVSDDDELILSILDKYLLDKEQGNHPDIDELVNQYPQIADRLRDCLRSVEAMDHFATVSDPNNTPKPFPIFDDFEVHSELGRGGMGIVYKARQISLSRFVALKVLPISGLLDETTLARFKNEALATASLDHPNIINVYNVGVENGVHYYAMHLVEGKSLSQIIQSLKLNSTVQSHDDLSNNETRSELTDEPPSVANLSSATASKSGFDVYDNSRDASFVKAVVKAGIQVANALHHAHENGIIHRDIKPSNLLIDGRGDVWVSDFGLARMQTEVNLTMAGDVLGTLRYMSPEQAVPEQQVIDHRTDIYSLGLTLYELLTLRPAVSGNTRKEICSQILHDNPLSPRKINNSVSRDLETIIAKALAKERDRRYSSARELADDFQRLLDHQPIKAKRQTTVDHLTRWALRHRIAVAAVMSALVLSLIALVVSNIVVSKAWFRSTAAEHESLIHLKNSQIESARAIRNGINSGRRFDAIEKLKLAIANSIKLGTLKEDLPVLRTEVIASLAWTDSKPLFEFNTDPEQSIHLFLDRAARKYVALESPGSIRLGWVDPGHQVDRIISYDENISRISLSSSGNHFVTITASAIKFFSWDQPETPFAQLDYATDKSWSCQQFDVNSSGTFAGWNSTRRGLEFFDLQKQAIVQTITRNENLQIGIMKFCFVEQDQVLLTGISEPNSGEIIRLPDGKRLQYFDQTKATRGLFRSTDYEPDNKLAMIASDDEINVWKIEAGKKTHIGQSQLGRNVQCYFISHQGDVAIFSEDEIKIWNVFSNHYSSLPNFGVNVFLGRDGRLVVPGVTKHQVLQIEISNTYRTSPGIQYLGSTGSLSFDISGNVLIASGHEPFARFYDVSEAQFLTLFSLPLVESRRQCVCFHPNRNQLFTSSANGLQQWNLLEQHLDGNRFWIARLERTLLSPDWHACDFVVRSDNTLTFADSRSRLFELDLNDKEAQPVELVTPDLNDGFSPRMAFSPNGKFAAYALAKGGFEQVWDLRTGEVVFRDPIDTERFGVRYAFSPDSKLLVGGRFDGYKFVNTRDWTESYTIPADDFLDIEKRVAFTSDMSLGAAVVSNNVVQLFDPKTGTRLTDVISPENGELNMIAFSPDNKRLVAMSGAGVMQFWNLEKIDSELTDMGIGFETPIHFISGTHGNDEKPLTKIRTLKSPQNDGRLVFHPLELSYETSAGYTRRRIEIDKPVSVAWHTDHQPCSLSTHVFVDQGTCNLQLNLSSSDPERILEVEVNGIEVAQGNLNDIEAALQQVDVAWNRGVNSITIKLGQANDLDSSQALGQPNQDDEHFLAIESIELVPVD